MSKDYIELGWLCPRELEREASEAGGPWAPVSSDGLVTDS